MRLREVDGADVTSVGMTQNAHARIARQDALEPSLRTLSSISDHHHSGVLRVADADTAAVVNGNPRRASGRVHERIQQRPIRDRITAIEHPFSFTER